MQEAKIAQNPVAWKKPLRPRKTGSDGDRTWQSTNGAPCAEDYSDDGEAWG